MEKVAQRSDNDVVTPKTNIDTSTSVKPAYKPNNNRSNSAFAAVSHITTSAEISTPKKSTANPISNINSRSVSLKAQTRSPMAAIEDDLLHNVDHLPTKTRSSSSTVPGKNVAPSNTSPLSKKKKSVFPTQSNKGEEYTSIPESESGITIASRTPPHSNTPLFIPRYANSPPAGSGGKYMMKSKRASWIVDAGATASVAETMSYHSGSSASTPLTPISFPETAKSARSRKTSAISTDSSKRYIPFEESASSLSNQSSMDSCLNYNKSGSISKLRENRSSSPNLYDDVSNTGQYHRLHRNSSISSVLTDNVSFISSEGYESYGDNDSFSNLKCTCLFLYSYLGGLSLM